MAEAFGVSNATVARIWQAHGLQPHRVRPFKVSRDTQFAEKLRDVVGLYLNPPDKALVLCVDEKSQIQALDRTQPGLPMKKGRCGTLTHDYKRNGTTTLFAALNMLDGKVIGQCHAPASSRSSRVPGHLDRNTPAELDLHLIVDNYSTHKHPTVKRWLEKHPVSICISSRRVPRGSTWSNAGSATSPTRPSAAGPSRVSRVDRRHPAIPRRPQRRSQALHLDEVGRGDPGEGGSL